MRVAALGSLESWYVKDLRRAAPRGCHVFAVPFRGLRGWIGSGTKQLDAMPAGPAQDASGALDLGRVDAILVRTMPPGTLEQVVYRMDALLRLEATGIAVLNPPRAIETAVDKYLATSRLEAAGLPTPPTVACETTEMAMEAFAHLGGDVVVKPLFGSEGRGIIRVGDTDLAYRAFRALEQLGTVIYQQTFVPHEGCDLRALVLGGQVVAAMRRRAASDWRTNVSRGALAEPAMLSEQQSDLAVRAAAAVGAPLAGVDLLPTSEGRCYVLEVNAVPGWRALARATKVDVAAAIVGYLIERIGQER